MKYNDFIKEVGNALQRTKENEKEAFIWIKSSKRMIIISVLADAKTDEITKIAVNNQEIELTERNIQGLIETCKEIEKEERQDFIEEYISKGKELLSSEYIPKLECFVKNTSECVVKTTIVALERIQEGLDPYEDNTFGFDRNVKQYVNQFMSGLVYSEEAIKRGKIKKLNKEDAKLYEEEHELTARLEEIKLKRQEIAESIQDIKSSKILQK